MSQALGLVHDIPVPFHPYKDPRMQVFLLRSWLWLSYRTNSHISVVSHRKTPKVFFLTLAQYPGGLVALCVAVHTLEHMASGFSQWRKGGLDTFILS